MMDRPKIDVVADSETLARTMVELFTRCVRKTLDSKKSFRIAVSGGSTPRRFFELLGQAGSSLGIVWEQCHVFWVDERFVSPTSDASNYKSAKEAWLDRVPIPQGNVHRVPTDAENAQEAAHRYECMLREAFAIDQNAWPQFDLIILGMGSDGHTASLFPGTVHCGSPDALAWAIDLPVRNSSRQKGAPDYARITLTPAVIRAASRVVVLISGKDKADMLKTLLDGQADEKDLPIRILWPVLEKITWLVDREAASRL